MGAWKPPIDGQKGHYTSEPAPGKVKAYRFMTFYLPPSERTAEAFRGIVNPVWLARSTDAAAVVLRSADTSNPAWRIFHRVTYVERVPPGASDEPVASRASRVRAPVNIRGNITLLGLVMTELGAGPPTPYQIGRAVQRVLNPAPDASGNYPPALIEKSLPWWGGFLDKARPGANQDAAAAELLTRIFTNILSYVKNGYASGVLKAAIKLQR